MAIRVSIDGVSFDVSKDELFEMARRGEIGPDTEIVSGETHTTAGKVKGIVFGSVVPPLAQSSGPPPTPDDKKTVCANCGTILDADVKFCPECGASTVLNKSLQEMQELYGPPVNAVPPPAASEKSAKMHPLAKFIGGFILLSVLFSFCNLDLSNETPEQKQQRIQKDAFYSACQFVERDQLSPKSAKFCSYNEAIVSPNPQPGGQIECTVGGWVESQNAFGVMIRKNWSITIRLDGTTWRHVYGPVYGL